MWQRIQFSTNILLRKCWLQHDCHSPRRLKMKMKDPCFRYNFTFVIFIIESYAIQNKGEHRQNTRERVVNSALFSYLKVYYFMWPQLISHRKLENLIFLSSKKHKTAKNSIGEGTKSPNLLLLYKYSQICRKKINNQFSSSKFVFLKD